MSVSDRGPIKCGKPSRKDGEGSDLSLSGSQVSLVSRPRSVTGKASIRALSVSGPRPRRPMSAMPTLSYIDNAKSKRRPYSADSQPVMALSHQRLNKACFSLTSDFMDHVLQAPSQDLDMDGDLEFSSSTLLSSHMSDQLENAWLDLEAKGAYLNKIEPLYQSYSTDNSSDLFCYSDISEEPTRSEKSLGEHIRTMAQYHIHDISMPNTQSSPKTNSPSISATNASSDKECSRDDYQNNIKGDDPKNMTTRELHFRMVESGLFLNSKPKSSKAFKEAEPSVHHTVKNTVPERNVKSANINFLGEGKNENLSKNEASFDSEISSENQLTLSCFPKEDTGSDKFWQSRNGLDSLLDKAVSSLDEVSFPEEHDVDSLDGDSRNSNHGLSSSGGLGQVSENNGNTHKEGWMKQSVIPVRFQQWVTGSHSENASAINESSCTFYFCGAQPSSPHLKTVDTDCTVEEVSADLEYKDESHCVSNGMCKDSKTDITPRDTSDTSEFKETGAPDLSLEEKLRATVSDKCPSGNRESLDTLNCQESVEMLHVEDKCEEHVSADQKKKMSESAQSGNYFVDKHEIPNFVADKYSKKEAYNDISKPLNETDKDSSHTPTTNSTQKKGISSVIQRRKKCVERKNDFQFISEKNSQLSSKRKMENRFQSTPSKPNGISRKTGRSTFSQPVEENLPGETQPELVSWMSMCSEHLDHVNSKVPIVSSQSKDTASTSSAVISENKDSPYNEILTILRVLEENEDESSLDRILLKRGHGQSGFTNQEEKTDIPLRNSALETFDKNEKAQESDNHVSAPSVAPDNIIPEDSQAYAVPNSETCAEIVNIIKPPEPSHSLNGSSLQLPPKGELRELLTFLDAVDQSCSSVLHLNPQSTPVDSQPLTSASSPELEELLLMRQSDLAQEIVSLRLSLEERDATIKLLRCALREHKDNQQRKDAFHCKELEDRMRQVKAECEAVVKRHQKFIDQLIADKTSLSERCETLIQEGRLAEEKRNKSICNLEEKHKVELQRMKDITAATEKLKRERWVETKTQKIKELTVRGLEPELTRLNAQHEQEMSALRTLHAQELEQIELRAARRASQQMETLREQLIHEKEDALAREREVLRQRMEKQQLLYEEEGTEQRRRLVAEVRRERDRIATVEARLETQFEERKRALEREFEQERERLRREYGDKIDEIHRKQQLEVSQLREALKAEKDAWLENFQLQQKQAMAQTAAEIREQLKRERDREIEVVIERLESEASLTREEKEKAAENRLRRVREQLTSELREVECSLNALKDKYSEARAQLQEKEDKLVGIEINNRSLQTQLLETQKVADQLSAERADLKQVLRCELNIEMETLRQQLAEQHSRHQQELRVFSEQAERERSNHQQELQQLYNRVKLAIGKKEEVVKAARAKQKVAEDQSAHLQALLEQRRRESILR